MHNDIKAALDALDGAVKQVNEVCLENHSRGHVLADLLAQQASALASLKDAIESCSATNASLLILVTTLLQHHSDDPSFNSRMAAAVELMEVAGLVSTVPDHLLVERNRITRKILELSDLDC